MNYTMECVVYADSYGEAIEKFGGWMDKLYGPKWKLTRSDARPSVEIRSGTGEHLHYAWQFDMAAEWLGPVSNQERKPS